MRVETIEHAIQFLPCEGEELNQASKEFEALAPLHFKGVESLYRLTVEGYFKVEQINFNGCPAFVLWWSKTIEGSLCVHAVQSLRSGVAIDVLFIAADVMRKREGCNSIVISSTRQGMVRKARQHGFQFHSMTMRKV
jgi:hypothetical protein